MSNLQELEKTYNGLKARLKHEPFLNCNECTLWDDQISTGQETLIESTEKYYEKIRLGLAFSKENVANTFQLIELQANRGLAKLPNNRPTEAPSRQLSNPTVQPSIHPSIQRRELPQPNSTETDCGLCKVVRDVATMRTTVDIEALDSKVICKIPRHTQLLYDSSRVLYAGLEEDLVDVMRLHVLVNLQDVLQFRAGDAAAVSGDYMSYSELSNPKLPLSSHCQTPGWIRGWVSLHGRTVEDHAAIVEVLRNPRKEVISLL